mgnify:FL=1
MKIFYPPTTKKIHFLIQLSEIITIFATVTLAENPQEGRRPGRHIHIKA